AERQEELMSTPRPRPAKRPHREFLHCERDALAKRADVALVLLAACQTGQLLPCAVYPFEEGFDGSRVTQQGGHESSPDGGELLNLHTCRAREQRIDQSIGRNISGWGECRGRRRSRCCPARSRTGNALASPTTLPAGHLLPFRSPLERIAGQAVR